MREDAQKAIAAHFTVPPEVRQQARYANYDLYYGPVNGGDDDEEGEPYHGFETATAMVGEWCNDNLHDVWYDTQSGFVSDREPEGYREQCCACGGTGNDPDFDDDEDAEDGDCTRCDGSGVEWVEPTWEDYMHFEVADVKRALFDTELVSYI